jgi:zinc transporter, ZIP family
MTSPLIKAIIITLIVGLSINVGNVIGITLKKENHKFFTFSLGLAAGIMIGISFLDFIPEGIARIGLLYTIILFTCGFIFIFLLDSLVIDRLFESKDEDGNDTERKVAKTSSFITLGVVLHNFPEGLAVLFSSIIDVKIGIIIGIAIALHHIPEGIAVSMPIYRSTGNKGKTFLWSFIISLVPLLGAIIAGTLFFKILNPNILAFILSGVSGIMCYIAIDEILPLSRTWGVNYLGMTGFISAIIIITLSLVLIK